MRRRDLWTGVIAGVGVLALALLLIPWLALAGGNCSVYKTFATNDVLTAADLNNSLTQAAVTNQTTDCLAGYSATVTQMGSTADPFPGGAASLATSLTGEIQRLRYQIAAITGGANWYNRANPLNPPGDIALGVAGTSSKTLYFHHSSTFYTAFTPQPTATVTYSLPFQAPPSVGSFLTSTAASTAAGNPASLSWAGPRSYLAGLTLSNDGVTPATVIDVAAGTATASDQTVGLTLATAVTKNANAAWTVGTGNGCLDVGSALAASKTYHVYVIGRVDTSVIDVLCSLVASQPSLPTSYTKARRIGAFLTGGASTILAFVQDGDYFQWTNPTTLGLDFNVNNPGTTAVLRTLNVPTGVAVRAVLNLQINQDTATRSPLYLSDPATTDVAPADATSPLGAVECNVSAACIVGGVIVRTNTSGQIRTRTGVSSASVTIYGQVIGWYDRRGQDS